MRRISNAVSLRRGLAIGLGLLGVGAVYALTATRAAADGAPSIAQVVDAAASYAGQQVTLVGTVDPDPIAYGGDCLYALRQAGRAISVLGRAPAPAAGTQLSVTGQVALRPPDDEFAFPPLILETQRTPLP